MNNSGCSLSSHLGLFRHYLCLNNLFSNQNYFHLFLKNIFKAIKILKERLEQTCKKIRDSFKTKQTFIKIIKFVKDQTITQLLLFHTILYKDTIQSGPMRRNSVLQKISIQLYFLLRPKLFYTPSPPLPVCIRKQFHIRKPAYNLFLYILEIKKCYIRFPILYILAAPDCMAAIFFLHKAWIFTDTICAFKYRMP